MANYCYFEGKLVGKKEEVEEVFGYFNNLGGKSRLLVSEMKAY